MVAIYSHYSCVSWSQLSFRFGFVFLFIFFIFIFAFLSCTMSGSNPCDPHADCKSTGRQYRCVCQAGYEGDGFTCNEVLLTLCTFLKLVWR